jgi:hypothetical protein
MNSRDEQLTRKNVNEQIERCLALLQDPQPQTMTALSRTVRDLQGIYEEDRRLEHIWRRINSRVSARKALRIIHETEELATVRVAQSVVIGGSGIGKWLRRLLRLVRFLVRILLLTTIVLLAYLIWSMWSHGGGW